MSPRFVLFASLTLTACLQLGCEMRDQLKDMHDNTAQMNKTTGTLADSTAQTVQMMGELYDASRQGTAMDLRKKLYDSIVLEKALDSKMINAAKYYMAFEFELWSGQGQDREIDRRHVLAKDAVEELFNHLKTVSHWDDEDLDPFANPETPSLTPEIISKKNQMAVFNALAATVHYTNRKQDPVTDKNNIPKLSMYSLIEESLLAGAEIRRGAKRIADYPIYVDEVLKTEALAIQFLKARYNVLGVMIIGQVSRISKSLWDGVKIKILNQKWNLETEKMSPSEVRSYRALLDQAEKTKQLLVRLGVSVELDKSVKSIFSKMQIPAQTQSAMKPMSVLDSEKQAFIDSLNQYRGIK